METLSQHPQWEFLLLRLKPEEHDPRPVRLPVAAVWCYRGSEHYSPMILGMDYDFLVSQTVQTSRVQLLSVPTRWASSACCWVSEDTEKRKFGCRQVPKMAFVQAKDNFNFELIETMGISDVVERLGSGAL